jgi:hypothetical protein
MSTSPGGIHDVFFENGGGLAKDNESQCFFWLVTVYPEHGGVRWVEMERRTKPREHFT